jgi:ADP-ribose pyrophosphatase YjhB (NUDIX family)
MKRDYPDRPIVGVLAVVRRIGQVLIVKRARAPSEGRWGFPGGVQELGETVREAAIRELAEETGVRATALGTLPILDAIRPDATGRIQAHWTLVPVVCDWCAGEGEISNEVAALRWVEPEGVDRLGLDMLPNVDWLGRLALGWRPDR